VRPVASVRRAQYCSRVTRDPGGAIRGGTPAASASGGPVRSWSAALGRTRPPSPARGRQASTGPGASTRSRSAPVPISETAPRAQRSTNSA
jgi:hypothetical protein